MQLENRAKKAQTTYTVMREFEQLFNPDRSRLWPLRGTADAGGTAPTTKPACPTGVNLRRQQRQWFWHRLQLCQLVRVFEPFFGFGLYTEPTGSAGRSKGPSNPLLVTTQLNCFFLEMEIREMWLEDYLTPPFRNKKLIPFFEKFFIPSWCSLFPKKLPPHHRRVGADPLLLLHAPPLPVTWGHAACPQPASERERHAARLPRKNIML